VIPLNPLGLQEVPDRCTGRMRRQQNIFQDCTMEDMEIYWGGGGEEEEEGRHWLGMLD